jgi:hypothetical protein
MRRSALVRASWFVVLLFSTLLLTASEARAQAPSIGSRDFAIRGDHAAPKVFVLTMGPGDHPFARFGHNALLLTWPGRAVVYNWGTFAFEGMQGIEDFMAGRFRYWLSLARLDRTLDFYEMQNRTLVAQELDLTEDERKSLAAAVAANALPENRYYNYDYFKDNCTTRVRDVVDRALGGALKRAVTGSGHYTFREHAMRLSAPEPWLYFGLDLALGRLTDQGTPRYDELWIPDQLQAALAEAKISRNGEVRPLVLDTKTLVTAERPAALDAPPSRVGWFLLIGALLGALAFALGEKGRTHRAARAVFGAFAMLFGTVFGLVGCILLFFWLFTKHWSAYQNENLLVCTPWALALLVTAFGLALGRPRSTEWTRQLLFASTLTSLLAVLLALIPGFGQDNTRIAALFAPIWCGLYSGACRLTNRGFQILRFR